MRISLGLSCSVLTLFWCTASPQAQPSRFIEKPGVLEFSGMMIVKPHSFSTLVQKTGNSAFALMSQIASRMRILSNTLEYHDEVDEYIVAVPKGFDENTYSERLMGTGYYEYVIPNWIVYPVTDPNDPLYPQQWQHVNIASAKAWDIYTGTSNIICAFTDTGVDHLHPDLLTSLVPGYNSASGQAESDGGDTSDINGHGTHVAGCAAAIGNNLIGVVGVGWNFKIMPIRVTNSPGGSASLDDLLEGARWAVDHGAKVISASYSGVEYSTIQTTGAYIRSKGGLYLYAAGNSSTNLSWFDYPDVVVVGATDPNDNRAWFSSYGKAVDVFAPGTDIWSTYIGGGYAALSGTSMATPIANGVFAIVWSFNPKLTSQQVELIVERSCDDLGAKGNDSTYGWGRVNSFKALKSARAGKLPGIP
ncbi:MAG TPA: S8 family serine peptidase [Fimbriimonadales bacterium]|nr:S8 family serine peptidase [Fimbriimonadales bacterium]